MRWSLRGERGSATTQLVLVTPALLTLLMLIVQVGLWFHASHVAHAAAQEGARAARAETGSQAAGQARAVDFLDSLGRRLILDRHVTATRTTETARVEISGHVAPVLPGMRLPVRAVAEGSVERFRAP
jgi:Flp pilus assembly protein TadG